MQTELSLSDSDDLECPLCMEEIDVSDKYFRPCPCGYQICRFCWNHINENLNGLCPACRRLYSPDSVQFKPVAPEELSRIKAAKKRKEREKKEQEFAARKQLANVRVIQKNLVYALGLPAKICSEEILKQNDYFGQYGKILKIVVNRRPTNNSQDHPAIGGVYITYVRKEDATKAIEAVDSSICEGRVIKATYGTTKYCSYYLRNQPCQNTLCQYLHEPGEEADTYLREESKTRSTITKPPVFPSLSRKDAHEDTTLPLAAHWAKPGSTSRPPVLDYTYDESSQPHQESSKASVDSEVTPQPPETLKEHLSLKTYGFVYHILYSGSFDPFKEPTPFEPPSQTVGSSKFEKLFNNNDISNYQPSSTTNIPQQPFYTPETPAKSNNDELIRTLLGSRDVKPVINTNDLAPGFNRDVRNDVAGQSLMGLKMQDPRVRNYNAFGQNGNMHPMTNTERYGTPYADNEYGLSTTNTSRTSNQPDRWGNEGAGTIPASAVKLTPPPPRPLYINSTQTSTSQVEADKTPQPKQITKITLSDLKANAANPIKCSRMILENLHLSIVTEYINSLEVSHLSIELMKQLIHTPTSRKLDEILAIFVRNAAASPLLYPDPSFQRTRVVQIICSFFEHLIETLSRKEYYLDIQEFCMEHIRHKEVSVLFQKLNKDNQ